MLDYIRQSFLKDEGFSMIEAVVSAGLLALTVTVFAFCMGIIYGNPKIVFRGKAFRLAENEMKRTLVIDMPSDTIYKNGRLYVRRTCLSSPQLVKLKVDVFLLKDYNMTENKGLKSNEIEIVFLEAIKNNRE